MPRQPPLKAKRRLQTSRNFEAISNRRWWTRCVEHRKFRPRRISIMEGKTREYFAYMYEVGHDVLKIGSLSLRSRRVRCSEDLLG